MQTSFVKYFEKWCVSIKYFKRATTIKQKNKIISGIKAKVFFEKQIKI